MRVRALEKDVMARLTPVAPCAVGFTVCLLELADKTDFRFVLETNGIFIGDDAYYAPELSRFHNVHVRVSFKATNQEEFVRLTGAALDAF